MSDRDAVTAHGLNRSAVKGSPGLARLMPAALVLGVTLLAGCGQATQPARLQNGTFTGTSSADEKGAIGEVTITVKDNTVVAATYVTRQKDGSIKDENYGKANGEIENPEFYKKAQAAVAASKQYAVELVEVGDVDEVDVISGATISYGQFIEAANQAMDAARE